MGFGSIAATQIANSPNGVREAAYSAIWNKTSRSSWPMAISFCIKQWIRSSLTASPRFDAPLCMVGCWIALEDVRPGSGELSYIVGSHRLEDFPFSTGKKDGIGVSSEEQRRSLQWVVAESEKRGLPKEVFSAKKGDALIWHADLAHGGRPITDPSLTRQSVVGHLSPLSVGRSAHPGSQVRKHGSLYYSSTYYNLKKIPQPAKDIKGWIGRALRRQQMAAGGNGAQGRNRTSDTVIFSHVLYQLSYLGARMGRRAPAVRQAVF